MTKLLLAIKSCERDARNGCHQAIRETWAKDVKGADFYFFVGNGGYPLKSDEIRVDCADDYLSLPHKTRAILAWAIDRHYDYIFLCDTDTFVLPDRLLASGFEQYDLVGLFNGQIGKPNATEGKYWAWISGGNGYWLSKAAALVVRDHPYDGDWAEDRITGQALGPYFNRGQLKGFSNSDYGFCTDGDELKTRITSHHCTQGMRRGFDPSWHRRRYEYNVLQRR